MPKNYLFLILLLSFVQLSAQKKVESDFILTLNGARIEGEIKVQTLREHQKGCQFKAKGENTYQTYTPTQLQAFYTRKTYFVSKRLPDSLKAEQLFLECYFQGKYSLYGKGNKLYIEGDSITLRPLNINGGVVSKDGIVVKRADGDFLKLLRRFSRECAGLGLQIQANVRNYDLKSFLDLLEDYHKCLSLPYKRYGIPKETYSLQWELGAALGAAQMPLKSSFMGLSFYDLILHQGIGFSANGAMILRPQRFVFFPSLVLAPEYALYAYSQNNARYVDVEARRSTYVESHFRANFLAIPIYIRQPIARLSKGFVSAELGTRIESIVGFSDMQYLIENENRQYTYVESAQFNYFLDRAPGFSVGILAGLRLSLGDETTATGAYAIGFRYSRVKKNNLRPLAFDQPILLRNSLYTFYFSKRF